MRKFGLALFVGFVVACGGADQPPPQPPPPPPPPPPAAPADTTPAPAATAEAPAPKPSLADMEAAAVASMVTNVNDAAKIAALYAPDATQLVPGYLESKGRDEIQKGYQGWLDTTTGAQTANVRIWTKGHQVVVHWITTATDKATGKPWGVDGVSLYTFNDDGLITQDHTYFDLVTVMKQSGAYKDERPFRPVATLPTGAAETHVAKGDEIENANVANATATTNASLKNDEKALLGLYADDYVSNSFTGWEPKDKKWMKEVVAINKKSLKDRSWKDWALFGVEDFTIDEGEATATQIGAIDHGKIHIPNTHKTVTTHGLSISQWKDGKVVKSWSWGNGMELYKQLEIGPAAPKAAAKTAAKTDAAAKPAKK